LVISTFTLYVAQCFIFELDTVVGAMYLDGGLLPCQRLIAFTLFHDYPTLQETWMNYQPHPLQRREPGGDRHLIARSLFLQELTELENSIGIEFKHICLLARAFTHSSVGYNYLTLGSYERLELLGDAVFQLIVSHHLYCHFPGHNQGSLTAFRSSLVNSTVQSSLAMELGLDKYIKCGQREVSNLLVKIQSHATIKPSKTSFKALKVLNSLSIMC
jgi:ribonuclease-3